MLKAESASFPSVGEVNKDKGTVDFKDYKGVTYNTCTSVDYDRPWCVTDSEHCSAVDMNGNVTMRDKQQTTEQT